MREISRKANQCHQQQRSHLVAIFCFQTVSATVDRICVNTKTSNIETCFLFILLPSIQSANQPAKQYAQLSSHTVCLPSAIILCHLLKLRED